VQLSHDGLSLWYGTPDAPAPLDEVVRRDNAVVAVGVHPANPTNAVHVRYRVDGGFVHTAPGREIRTDHDRQTQYFIAKFPWLPVGHAVEYSPMLICAGRQVPAATREERFPSKFLLADPEPTAIEPAVSSQSGARWPQPELDFVAAITLHLNPPQFIGETPEGVRVNFYVKHGTVIGPNVSGTVFPSSSDHMMIRPDGVGVIHVRAVVCVDDGALLEITETGYVDFGEDGYRHALAKSLPTQSSFVVTTRVLTAHPKYRWLNRVHCVSQGRTHLEDLVVSHDVFAVKARTL
jgi:hypothetical protein